MKRYTDQVLSRATGLPMIGARVLVNSAGTNLPAAIYAVDDETAPQAANPFTASGSFDFYAADGRYDIIVTAGTRVSRLLDVELVDLLEIVRRLEAVENGEPGAPGSLRADLLKPDGGSRSMVRVRATGALPRTAEGKASDVLSVLDFIPEELHAAISQGISTADVTQYFQKAFAHLNRVGVSGALYVPHGIYRVSSLAINYAVPAPIRMYGDGPLSSVIRKIGVGNAFDNLPVLAADASGILDVYLQIENISFDAGNMGPCALRLTNCARVRLERVAADSAPIGIDLAGCLISELIKCRTDGNVTGVRTRKGAVFPNLIIIEQHECRQNSGWGFDIGDGEAIRIVDPEILRCGTSGNAQSGGMIIRASVGSEAGIGSVKVENAYFELNYANGLVVEDNLALSLTISSPGFYATEGGACAKIGNIRSSTIEDPKASGDTDTVRVAAQNSVVVGGVIKHLLDTSVNRVRMGSTTETTAYALFANKLIGFAAPGSEFFLSSEAEVSGGSVNDTAIYKYGGRLNFRFPTNSIPLALELGKVGFFQAAPVGKQAVEGPASDAATTLALVNSLRSALVTYGLAQ